MIVNCFVIFIFCFGLLYTAQADKSSNGKNSKLSLESYFNETKLLSQQLKDVNSTDIESNTILYEKWSKWSKCRNCKKVRRKYCISPKCKNSILYEERPCNIARCRRKFRAKRINVIQKIETRNLKEDDSLYTSWSEWTTCSKQCITRRHRYCRKRGTCLQNPDVQMAYCYKENTECHRWIQNMLERQTRNKKYAYDIETTNRKNKKMKTKKVRKCGIAYRSRYRPMTKIMGGTIAKSTKWPWHVALLNWHKEVFCGGTLISANWVLTAAHCLRNILYVRLNEYDISYDDGSEIEYFITHKFAHHKYDSQIVDNDIALLKLPKSVPLPYACLPTTAALPVKQNCTIVGWGKRAPHEIMGSKYLREAQMPIVPKPICKRSYRKYVITDNMFCAGYRNGGIDTCSGDSGGGFMCLPKGKRYGWTVQGITSFGESCGKKGKYGIYTDVRKYLPWIKRKIKQS